MGWVPIDYEEVLDKRRSFPNQKGMARALEVDFPPEKKAEDSYDLETTGEVFQKLFGDDEVDPEHIAEVKRIMGIKPEASPYARLAEVYAIGIQGEDDGSREEHLRRADPQQREPQGTWGVQPLRPGESSTLMFFQFGSV
jgi:hypothetical protein